MINLSIVNLIETNDGKVHENRRNKCLKHKMR